MITKIALSTKQEYGWKEIRNKHREQMQMAMTMEREGVSRWSRRNENSQLDSILQRQCKAKQWIVMDLQSWGMFIVSVDTGQKKAMKENRKRERELEICHKMRLFETHKFRYPIRIAYCIFGSELKASNRTSQHHNNKIIQIDLDLTSA